MINTALRVALYEPLSGLAGITVAQFITLLQGSNPNMIDTTQRIALYPPRSGLPGATLAAIIAQAGGGPPAINSTRNFINELLPQHFYTLSQVVGSTNFGDSGVGPAGIPIVNSPLFANSIPMANEAITTAALFDGVNDHGVNTNDVDGFDTGTVFVFFNLAASLAANAQFYGQSNSDGATRFILQFFADDRVRIFISRDGAGVNVYSSFFDYSALLTFNTWHLLAARQDGTGITWFFDDQFFTVADAEVTESTLGNLDNTAWLAETLVAAAPADRSFMGADAVGNQPFAGQVFNQVNDDRVWTDTELTDLFNLAVTNGLNA